MKFGMTLNAARGADSVMAEARQADAQGFDSVWLFDHLTSFRAGTPNRPNEPLETWTLAAAIGGATSRVRLGFAMLNTTFRYPAVLAKMITTLDQVTRGRVICSVGAGWLESEYKAYDLPFIADHDARIGYAREVIQLFKELWTHPAPALTTFTGKHLKTHELPFNPEPFQKPHPPIWIGGDSPEILESVKELADGWIMLRPPMSRAELAKIIEAPGWPRRPMTVVFSFATVLVAETRDEALGLARAAFEAAPPPSARAGTQAPSFEEFVGNPRALIGTPEEIAARIREVESWGYNYMRVGFSSAGLQERFARRVLPLVADRETAATR